MGELEDGGKRRDGVGIGGGRRGNRRDKGGGGDCANKRLPGGRQVDIASGI